MATKHFCGYLKERNAKRKVRIAYDRPNKVRINGIDVRFTRFFGESDTQSTLWAVRHAKRVVFIDTPPSRALLDTVNHLHNKGVEVHIRDHHDVKGEPTTPREKEIRESAEQLRYLLGSRAVISNRFDTPACSSLVLAGEFNSENTAIIADADPDGLTASMKAAGVTYDALDTDAVVLDGPRAPQGADTLTPDALLFTKAMGSLPAFDPKKPEVIEEARSRLFSDFVAMCEGSSEARARLESAVKNFEMRVEESERLLSESREIMSGVVFIDTRTSKGWDGATLVRGIENNESTKISVVLKSHGIIASQHGGVQYQLTVSRTHQNKVNLQNYLPKEFKSSPETGIISNTPFMLNVSESVYISEVVPRLREDFSSSVVSNSSTVIQGRADHFKSLRNENLARLKNEVAPTVHFQSRKAHVLPPKQGDEKQVTIAKRARAERERRQNHKLERRNPSKAYKEKTITFSKNSIDGAFRKPTTVDPNKGIKNPTNIGNPVPKGPTGSKQKQTTNPKKQAKRERKLSQRIR